MREAFYGMLTALGGDSAPGDALMQSHARGA